MFLPRDERNALKRRGTRRLQGSVKTNQYRVKVKLNRAQSLTFTAPVRLLTLNHTGILFLNLILKKMRVCSKYSAI